MTGKDELRQWALRRRALEETASVLEAGQACSRHIRCSVAYADARVVAGYLSMPGEPATGELLIGCHADGRQVVVPAWNPVLRRYAFCRWTPGIRLCRGPMQVPEPACKLWVAMQQPDLVLVPGLVFDRSGGRIGFGKGHYDRLLSRCRTGALFAGIAYDWQIVDRVPQASGDVRLHALATPSGWLPTVDRLPTPEHRCSRGR